MSKNVKIEGETDSKEIKLKEFETSEIIISKTSPYVFKFNIEMEE
jgi:hypothetical protein